MQLKQPPFNHVDISSDFRHIHNFCRYHKHIIIRTKLDFARMANVIVENIFSCEQVVKKVNPSLEFATEFATSWRF